MGRTVLVTVRLALALGATPARADGGPRVTVIGDSVLTAVEWNDGPTRILEDGLDVQLDIGVCRTLVGESCPFQGARVPTLVEEVHRLGSQIAPSVVVEVGYNDDPATFASAVEESLYALHDAGVREVRWLTLREVKSQYTAMNAVLRDAAARHPELALVDWNAYSAGHPEWFQNDGEHLVYGGAIAMASIIHAALRAPFASSTGAITVAAPPVARAQRRYAARLRADGGVGPYTFRVVTGRPPLGLHLRPDGRIYGRPRGRSSTRLTIQVTDMLGSTVLQPLMLRVR